MTLEFEFDGHDLSIDDPTCSESWVAGMQVFIDAFANEHYGTRYEQINHDLDSKMLRKLADGVGNALALYRPEFRKALIGAEPFTEWKDVLGDSLAQALNIEDFEEHDHALYGEDFSNLYEAIDEAMQGHDGPVADVDDLINDIRDAVRCKMEELDTSTIYDAVGRLRIPLMFVPGFSPGNGSIDDFDISADEIQECKRPGYGEQALLDLLRVSIPDFMEYKGFDHKNSELIDAWVSDIKDPTLDPSLMAHGPLYKDLNALDNFFSSAGGHNGVLPCWIGTLTPNSIKTIDPMKDCVLTGGLVSLNEHMNGSGAVEFLADQVVVLSGDWSLAREYGYSVEDTFGLTARSMQAEIKPIAEPELIKAPEPLEFSM